MKSCRACKLPFEPVRPLQVACSVTCAALLVLLQRERKAKKAATADRKATREKLRVLDETLPKLRKAAQDAFNSYIRLRDDKLSCICCGEWPKAGESLTGGAWDAGHYRSRGACPELAFDERNCHKQRKYCNARAWDVAGYRTELIRRIGIEQVTELEGPHPPKHYTREDLKAIRAEYLAKAKQLKNSAA